MAGYGSTINQATTTLCHNFSSSLLINQDSANYMHHLLLQLVTLHYADMSMCFKLFPPLTHQSCTSLALTK
jgi:hypothetical protein